MTGAVDSDVDLIVGRPPAELLRQLAERLASKNILLVQTWEYDRSERSSFFVDLKTLGSMQLDFVFDTRGRGVVGFRSDTLLAAAQPGLHWRTLDPLDSLLYRTRKRQVKRDVAALQTLREESEDFRHEDAVGRAHEVFEPRARRHLLKLLNSPDRLEPLGWGKGFPYQVGTWRRRLRRIQRPPGMLVVVPTSFDGHSLARDVDAKLIDATFLSTLSARTIARAILRSRKPTLTIVNKGRASSFLAKIIPSITLNTVDSSPQEQLFRKMHSHATRQL